MTRLVIPNTQPVSAGPLPDTVRAAFAPVGDLSEAEAYTRALAHSHYENFSVVTRLLPRHLRQDFCNVYAFCRIADDLGDEVGDPGVAVEYLGNFRDQLRAAYAGDVQTAVFVALKGTIGRHEIPIQPFLDLIDAFEQDQTVNRYDTFDQLVAYCRRSADPVGRLVLYMCGYRDAERQRLSDRTCTALQLTNFWQDVRRDYVDRNRIYIPRESMSRFGVSEDQIAAGRFDDSFGRLMRFEVARTTRMFEEGDALLPLLAPVYRRQISLFSRGGRAILGAIERQDYDTLTSRPRLSKLQKGRLIIRALTAAILQKFSRREQGGSAR
ncbi:MAG TPA: squalene synthase HpnC [Tepidisphaeraceae bacterium]|jgi:squalene synthase HpnC